ncbi:chaperonin GroEL-like [Triplophysa rosa]|uniref:chaperonin GroEL-like n=1 Tax=Triplophysa rosa TaxID=992332 RepID=UPI002545E448|nr:chaperonin GroEL-like [Triplophysa rosa]
MAAKDLIFSTDARNKLFQGISKLARAVRVTLGPRGRNVIIDKSYGAPRITKDGVTVAKEIDLSDKFENMGGRIIREVASKTCDMAGDGTTTSTVLAHAILEKSLKAIETGANPADLKKGIDIASKKVIEFLKDKSIEINDSKQIKQVATISANGEEEIGNVIAEGFKKTGPDGVMTVEDAKSFETELDVVEGMQFDRGYLSPYFVTNAEKMLVELDNPFVMIYDKKISSIQVIVPILEQVIKAGNKGLLLIAEDIEGDALAACVLNKMHGGLKICAVKAPGFGDRRKEILKDIAILCDGQVISDEIGIKLENVALADLGKCKTVKITKDSTTIIGGFGSKDSIDSRCKQLKAEIANPETSQYDREKCQERLAKLSGGIAVIRVGGATEIEVKERKDRVEDALGATKAAIREGIIVGGGVALLRAVNILKDIKSDNEDIKAGIDIFRSALFAPARQIADNAGFEGIIVANKILENSNFNFGFDASVGEYTDLFERGVIDPMMVIRAGIENAVSISTLAMLTEAMISEVESNNKPGMPNMPGGMGGMPMM